MYAHELCERLGGMTVGEMLDRMDADEFVRWKIFDDVRPATMAERQNALLIFRLSSIFGGSISFDDLLPKRGPRLTKPQDSTKPRRKPTDAEVAAALSRFRKSPP